MIIDPTPFRCPLCHSASLVAFATGLKCAQCGQSYPVRFGIIDFLTAPDAAVTKELKGLAAENNIDFDGSLDAVKFLRTPHIHTTEELMAGSRHERTQYYQQTSAAFYEGLARARPDAGLRVLEIGSERTYFALRTIKDLSTEAYALNIFFHVTAANEQSGWPVRILGDMNALPFQNDYLDLVIC